MSCLPLLIDLKQRLLLAGRPEAASPVLRAAHAHPQRPRRPPAQGGRSTRGFQLKQREMGRYYRACVPYQPAYL
jgi:hypothetical protein